MDLKTWKTLWQICFLTAIPFCIDGQAVKLNATTHKRIPAISGNMSEVNSSRKFDTKDLNDIFDVDFKVKIGDNATQSSQGVDKVSNRSGIQPAEFLGRSFWADALKVFGSEGSTPPPTPATTKYQAPNAFENLAKLFSMSKDDEQKEPPNPNIDQSYTFTGNNQKGSSQRGLDAHKIYKDFCDTTARFIDLGENTFFIFNNHD